MVPRSVTASVVRAGACGEDLDIEASGMKRSTIR